MSSKTCIQVKKLQLTSAAARYHLLRVYHQLQEWMNSDLDLLHWDQQETDGQFYPKVTDLPAAPEH